MEILANKPKAKMSQPVTLSVGFISMLGIVLGLIGFNKLTDRDRPEAGICVNYVRHDQSKV